MLPYIFHRLSRDHESAEILFQAPLLGLKGGYGQTRVQSRHFDPQDLLTIRADRDKYYFGADDLFGRHPEAARSRFALLHFSGCDGGSV